MRTAKCKNLKYMLSFICKHIHPHVILHKQIASVHWHWSNHIIALVPVKQPWGISVSNSHVSTKLIIHPNKTNHLAKLCTYVIDILWITFQKYSLLCYKCHLTLCWGRGIHQRLTWKHRNNLNIRNKPEKNAAFQYKTSVIPFAQ